MQVSELEKVLKDLRTLRTAIEPNGAFELARAQLVTDLDALFAAIIRVAPGAELRELADRVSQDLLDFGKMVGQVVNAMNPLFPSDTTIEPQPPKLL